MGIIGRFDRRNARNGIRLKHRHYPKHRMATHTSRNIPSPLPSQMKPYEPLSVQFQPGKHICVDAATSTIMRQEVEEILQSSSNHSCTALSMANALAQSQACLESHSKVNKEHNGLSLNKFLRKSGQGGVSVGEDSSKKAKRSRWQSRVKRNFSIFSGSFLSSRSRENDSIRLRYEWIGALNRLEKCSSSRDKIVTSWDEAKNILEDVINFPPVSEVRNLETNADPSSIEKKHREKLESEIEIVQENINTLSVSSLKWKQIGSYPDQRQLLNKSDDKGKSGGKEDLDTLIQKEAIEKADLYFNARIRTAAALNEALREKNDFVKKLEERKNAKNAEQRALSLLQTLTDDDRVIVEDAIHGFGNSHEVIARSGTDSVQRASMHTLKPGMWLNDEIIHYFYVMLAKRDEELCQNDPSRKRSHFFKSFFITKLLNEGNPSCDGEYEYKNVKRWSKKVPGKDIFELDKILFPINMGNMHWICAAIFMNEKRIQIFDSMGSSGTRYLDALFNYIQDEHIDKKKTPLPDADAWELVPTQGDTPRQTNGFDCGVFTCMFADFLSKDTALVFSQKHISQCRERIALSIMKGKAIM